MWSELNHTWKAGVKKFWLTGLPQALLRSQELKVHYKFTKRQSDLIQWQENDNEAQLPDTYWFVSMRSLSFSASRERTEMMHTSTVQDQEHEVLRTEVMPLTSF